MYRLAVLLGYRRRGIVRVENSPDKHQEAAQELIHDVGETAYGSECAACL
jgi:hypothetical protein